MAWISTTEATVASNDPTLTVGQASDPNDTTAGNITGDVLQEVLSNAVQQNPYSPAVASGQNTFTVPTVPTVPSSVTVEVNGILHHAPDDFTVAGTVVTWLGYTLDATDKVRITYL